ncbi:sugar phosphate isomerase/epimerase family protein [Pricia sp. S334]|uniref:Sugar phosphate isomerase/epimerase family protein n=1 Tax=Pricia mediterranea TaxID=3076079 RepID=A0ABU3L6A8_9FLAO|nr:sugar phosphate isomerase/epimerase family protein [Pricia sp. S334]MDT7829098.1 sugar phosphate isomerase/epimerase family protein [Pricia sp. S334]
MKRRKFIRNSSQAGLALSFLGMYACKETKKKEEENLEDADLTVEEVDPFFKLSLAQWSIHKMINNDGVDPYSFAEKAKDWGFSGLEYVSQLYPADLDNNEYSEEAMANFIEKSNAEAERHGMQNVLIMIDGQGNLAVSDDKERKEAVERHHKWVDAAKDMGCQSIRVNLAGSDEPEEWKANSVDGLTQLGGYAKEKGINILVENHGGLSSNGEMLADVMATVDMDNVGTLPDFGNFCIERSSDGCAEDYDKYKGVEELMPYAKAVSAKSNVFDEAGNERAIDYKKMLQIVKDHGYTGYIGVEFEGSELSEEEGIIATKELLLRAAQEMA